MSIVLANVKIGVLPRFMYKYVGTQTIAMTHATAGVSIRYTLDGSKPNSNSTLYTAPISISSTKTLRASAFLGGYEQSTTADYAYLIGVNHNIPIVYLTTDPKNLYDDSIGIYTDGTNGVQRYCAPYPVNWAQDWERPCNYKMFLPNGTMAFDVDGGVQIDGVCSRNYKLKSLGMDLKEKEYGDEKINYALFPQRMHSNYQRLKLRNGGQDYERTGIRDMVNHQLLIGKIDVDAQAALPVLVYINGNFHGIQNIQEKFTEEYFNALYDANEDSLDIIKSPGIPWNELKSGSFTQYNQLHSYMETADMNNDAQFAYFQSQVDIDEFLNYWVAMIYMANTDWPANNLIVWREKKAGSKWRYYVSDTDGSTNNGLSPEANPNANTFLVCNNASSVVFPNHKGSTLFLRKLLARPSFRDEFIQRTCSFIHLVYDAARTSPIIEAAKAQYLPNVPAHLALYASDTPPAMAGTINHWHAFVDSFKTFFVQRPVYMRQHLQEFYGLSGTYTLQFNYTAATNGNVFVNWTKMDVPYNYQGTYFKNVPLRITAVANPGYTFSHWLETGQTTATIEFTTNSNAFTLTPIFTSTTVGTLSITCPAHITTSAPSGANTMVVNYLAPAGTSTCTSGSVSTSRTSGLASGVAFPLGTVSVCYQANDGCGNTKSCCFTVTVNGTGSTNPCDNVSVVAGVGSINVNGLPTNKIAQIQILAAPIYNLVYICEGNGCSTPAMTIPNLPNGIYRVKVKLLESNYALICKKELDISVLSSNTGSITLNCPPNQTVTAAVGVNNAPVNYVAPVGTSTCTTGGVNTTRISGPASGAAFPVGVTNVCFRTSDGCTNTKSCCFAVTVNSNIAGNACANISAVATAGTITVNGLPTVGKAVTIDVKRLPTYVLAYNCNNTCNKPSQVINGIAVGNYTVKVKIYNINASGGWVFDCVKEMPVTVSIAAGNSNLISGENQENTTSPEFFMKNLTMYPNPTGDEVYFGGGENPPAEDGLLTFTDAYGRVAHSQVVNFVQEPNLQISLSHVPEGIYMVRIAFRGIRAYTRVLAVVRTR